MRYPSHSQKFLLNLLTLVVIMQSGLGLQQSMGTSESSQAQTATTPTPTPIENQGTVQEEPSSTNFLYLPIAIQEPLLGTGELVSPADAYYVQEDWANILNIDLDGDGILEENTRAYVRGYQADFANPNIEHAIVLSQILLAFGRQEYIDTEAGREWGVNLPDIGGIRQGFRSNSWVQARAQEFFNGYSAGHNQRTIIIIGTSNANYSAGSGGWTCENSSPDTLAASWEEAGREWANLVNSITQTSFVTKRSGYDIEAWSEFLDSDPPWSACGLGALAWYDGYESRTTITNINFGSYARAENEPQWTEWQMYLISYGRGTAQVLPQVYCGNSDVFVNGWIDLRRRYRLRFQGVTSSNSEGLLCGGSGREPTLSWIESWRTFHGALAAAGYTDAVRPTVSSFFYIRP